MSVVFALLRRLSRMERVGLLAFLAFILACDCELIPDITDESSSRCEKITVTYCQNIGYNLTRMPNLAGNVDQAVAEMELSSFQLLVTHGCSDQLQLFLCTIYTPYCTEQVDQIVHPCRPLCEQVRDSCLPVMKYYGYEWPTHLNCSRFPVKNNGNTMCNEGRFRNRTSTITTRPFIDKTAAVRTSARPSTRVLASLRPTTHPSNIARPTPFTRHDHIQSYKKICRRSSLRNAGSYFYVRKIRSCALGCNSDGLFTAAEKTTTARWIAVLAFSCLLLSMIGVCIAFVDLENTLYPERAIFLINACFWFYSLSHVLVITFGRDAVSCDNDAALGHRRFVLQDGSGHLLCALTFLLSYCFTMVQSVWWVVLTLTWFLSAGMKWKSDAIRSCSNYFHVAAWAVPGGKTALVLVLKKIDVDELTGICYVGSRFENLAALRGFVVGPLFTYLMMGTTFLVAGFLALFFVKSSSDVDPKNHSTTEAKLGKSLLPIGVYATVHTILSTFVSATYFYEYVNKESWHTDISSSGPNFRVFLLRQIVYFAIGISSACWILYYHLPNVWQKVLSRWKACETNDMRAGERMPFKGNSETPV